MTPDDLIAKYIELRDYSAVLEKKHEAELAPYKEALNDIESALAIYLNHAGVNSMKGEHGTAFKKPTMTVKTVDREALFKYVITTGQFNYLTSAVSKDAVTAHLEAYDNVPPPGIDVTFFNKVQVRKPS